MPYWFIPQIIGPIFFNNAGQYTVEEFEDLEHCIASYQPPSSPPQSPPSSSSSEDQETNFGSTDTPKSPTPSTRSMQVLLPKVDILQSISSSSLPSRQGSIGPGWLEDQTGGPTSSSSSSAPSLPVSSIYSSSSGQGSGVPSTTAPMISNLPTSKPINKEDSSISLPTKIDRGQ